MAQNTYRGFTLFQSESGDGTWIVYNSLGHEITRCNSGWGCIVYIDERLSP